MREWVIDTGWTGCPVKVKNSVEMLWESEGYEHQFCVVPMHIGPHMEDFYPDLYEFLQEMCPEGTDMQVILGHIIYISACE